MTREVREPAHLFLVAVALLLATATANVASVQLARSATRRREIAIRSALGAGGGRLARQLLDRERAPRPPRRPRRPPWRDVAAPRPAVAAAGGFSAAPD